MQLSTHLPGFVYHVLFWKYRTLKVEVVKSWKKVFLAPDL